MQSREDWAGAGDRDLSISVQHTKLDIGRADCHMLSAGRKQGRDVSPSWSDNPGLEVLLLLTGHTDGVTQVF